MDRELDTRYRYRRLGRRAVVGVGALGLAIAVLILLPGWLRPAVARAEVRTGRVDRGPVESRADLPGGASRLYAEALGVDAVVVAGVDVVRDGKLTGERPGRILRSGRDSVTVNVPGGAART